MCFILMIATMSRSKSSIEGVAVAIADQQNLVAGVPPGNAPGTSFNKGKGKGADTGGETSEGDMLTNPEGAMRQFAGSTK